VFDDRRKRASTALGHRGVALPWCANHGGGGGALDFIVVESTAFPSDLLIASQRPRCAEAMVLPMENAKAVEILSDRQMSRQFLPPPDVSDTREERTYCGKLLRAALSP
jgi:hypothetical protein